MSRIDDLIRNLCPDGVPFVELQDVFDLRNGYTPSKSKSEFWSGGTVPWFRMDDIRENGRVLSDSLQHVTGLAVKGGRLFPENSLLVATSATIGEHALVTVPHLSNQRFTALTVKSHFEKQFHTKFLFYYGFVLSAWCLRNTTQSSFASVDMARFKKFRWPVPPLEVQEEVVRILDTFSALTAELEAELEARRTQYEHYREKLLVVPESTSWATLGELCRIETGKLNANAAVDDGEYAFFTTAQEVSRIDRYRWNTEALLVAGNANVGAVKHYAGKFEAYQRTYVLTQFSEQVEVKFLFYVLKAGLQRYLEGRTNRAAMTYIVLATLRDLPVPVLPTAEQRRIVSVLDRFDALVNDTTSGLSAELEARRKQYEYYRDRLLSFEEAPA